MSATDKQASQHHCDVCIVGGGPTGLILAINLAQAGLSATVFESNVEIQKALRAIGHIPPVFPEFQKAGIMQQAKEASKSHSGWIHFRRSTDHEVIDAIPPMPGRPGPMVFPQSTLTRLLAERLAQVEGADLLMGHRVTEFTDPQNDTITVHVEDVKTDEKKSYVCKYVVGADGSKSFVRRKLGLSYEGTTLPFKFVSADVFYPFEDFGWNGANFMLGPENFGNIAHNDIVDGRVLWRVGTAFPVHMTDDEITAALPKQYQAMFPTATTNSNTNSKTNSDGDGKDHPPEFRYHTPPTTYDGHHFCVPRMRHGHAFLIGDAAHIANPFSGQLLACGIFDASALADCIAAVEKKGRPETLFDAWNDDRVAKFKNILEPLARACFEAVRHPDVESIGVRHPFLKAMKTMNMKAGPGAGPPPPPPSLATNVDVLGA